MKIFLTLVSFVVLYTTAHAQKYSLLYRKWNKPVIKKDSITNEDLNNGYFPIHTDEIDTLVSVLNKLQDVVNPKKQREVINMKEYATPSISFDITTVKRAYGDRYLIKMKSVDENYEVSIQITDPNYANSQNVKRLKALTEYIENGKSAGESYFQY